MTTHPGGTHGGLRLLALCAVTAGILLLAAAAFVLSYAGVHAVALAAGVSPRLARLYPPILDAMVVVAAAAVLSLRGAGLPSRWYAWLSLLVLLAAGAGADTLHVIGTRLPRRPAAATAAIIPWALLLIGFSLLLTMLRHARLRAESRRETGTSPEAGALAADSRTEFPAPEAGLPTSTAELPGPEPEPEADVESEADVEANVEPEAELDPEAGNGFQPEAELDPEAGNGLQPEAELDGGAGNGFQPEAGIEAEVPSGPGTTGASTGFDRVRSTPLPPGG